MHLAFLPPRALAPTRQRAAATTRCGLRPRELPRVCRVCKRGYVAAENHSAACRFHTARWMGAENSKHFGRVREGEGGTAYFYDCCDAEEQGAEGCATGFHKGYDDE